MIYSVHFFPILSALTCFHCANDAIICNDITWHYLSLFYRWHPSVYIILYTFDFFFNYNAVVQIYSCCVFCSHFRPPEGSVSPKFPFCLICYFRILLHSLSSLYLILFIQYGKSCLYSRTLYSFHNISVLVLVEISNISCCTISCSPNKAVNPYSTLNIISKWWTDNKLLKIHSKSHREMIDDWFLMMIGLLYADAFNADLQIQSCFYSAVCCMIHYGKRKTCNCKYKSVITIMPQCEPLQSKCHFDFIAPSGDNSSLGFAPQDLSKRRVQPFYSTGGPADASGCYGRCIPKT